jgi:hypothetical protein
MQAVPGEQALVQGDEEACRIDCGDDGDGRVWLLGRRGPGRGAGAPAGRNEDSDQDDGGEDHGGGAEDAVVPALTVKRGRAGVTGRGEGRRPGAG